MRILVLNSGSSSIKFELYTMPEEAREARGLLERIGEDESVLTVTQGGAKRRIARPVRDHGEGLALIMEVLTDASAGGLSDITEIGAVGHRVVHGGEAFAHTTLIDDAVVKALEDNSALAPLHNPPNLMGIRVAREMLPGVPQVAVFDTAFHQTMPESAYLYALPYELYETHRVRRYGFHGTSHRYVAARAAELLGKPAESVNLITAHLGNGASIAAIQGGRSVDTSMGLTPLEGLVMGTRSGDLDPGIPAYLARTLDLDVAEIDALLNKRSGLLGVSGISNDMRAIEDAAAEGNHRAQLALALFAYRVKKYVGAYTAVLGRVDALVFTGGVGENGPEMREAITEGLAPLGFALDPARNQGLRGKEADVATEGSASRILVVPTAEELMIARDTFALAR